MKARLLPLAVLVFLGLGWGSTQSLGKIATEGGHGFLALVFWQSVYAVFFLLPLVLVRGRPLLLDRRGLGFATLIALIGTVIPNSTFYLAVAHLPAGIMSIIISLIPLLSFPIALAMGTDRFSLMRLAGLVCGLIGVGFIVLPRAGLPDPSMVRWLPLAMIGPLCYALEANVVAKSGIGRLDSLQAMLLICLVSAVICLPLMLVSGQGFVPWPLGRSGQALLLLSGLQALLYTCYIGLARWAGAVFATQTSYLVTASGVGWAMLLLGERFSVWVWAALPFLFIGLFLVQPRTRSATVPQA